MATLIALIRGINLGGHKMVPMAGLREALTEHGYEDVRTILASGNVVLETTEKPAAVERQVAKAIAGGWGHDVEVIVRTAKQLDAVVRANPLGDVADGTKNQMVAFLSGKPGKAKLPDPAEYEPERYALDGADLHLWLPDGLRNSPLMKALGESKLGVSATVRNWNTVMKLHALACTSD